MKTADDDRIIRNMIKFGGHFVTRLGEAAKFADDENLARIKSAFPDYWAQYARPEWNRED